MEWLTSMQLPGIMDGWFGLSLLGLFAMTFIGSGLIPLPVTLVVFGLGAVGHPWWVVLAATFGTMAGWLFIGYKLQKHLSAKSFQMAQKSTPGWLRKLSLKLPFLSVFAMNALPMPWDPVRLILLAHGVKPKALLLPLGLGRFVRYGLVVWLGQAIDQMSTLVVVITVLMVVSIGVKAAKLLWERQKRPNLAMPSLDENDPEALEAAVEIAS